MRPCAGAERHWRGDDGSAQCHRPRSANGPKRQFAAVQRYGRRRWNIGPSVEWPIPPLLTRSGRQYLNAGVAFSVASRGAHPVDIGVHTSWPNEDALYAAFYRKDMAFDGVAYIAVRTTSIFCRPGCPAPMPLRRHVTFFRTAHDAVAVGYRACKRCRPLEPPRSASALVQRLVAEVDAEPTHRWSAADVEALGIDPVTARRHFQKRFGMSFLEYSRAHRLARAFSLSRPQEHPAHGSIYGTGADPVQELLEMLKPRLRYRSCYSGAGTSLKGSQCRSDLSIPTAPSYQHLRPSIRRHAQWPWPAGLLV